MVRAIIPDKTLHRLAPFQTVPPQGEIFFKHFLIRRVQEVFCISDNHHACADDTHFAMNQCASAGLAYSIQELLDFCSCRRHVFKQVNVEESDIVFAAIIFFVFEPVAFIAFCLGAQVDDGVDVKQACDQEQAQGVQLTAAIEPA